MSGTSTPLEPAPTSRRDQRRARRRVRRRASRAALVATPTVRVDQPGRRSRRERRRERRSEAALARTVATARFTGYSDDGARGRRRDERLGDYLARVEGPRLPERKPRSPRWLRRTAALGSVTVLIAGAAVLPWAAPGVRDWLADLVPDGESPVVRVEDPPVATSPDAFVGPIGVDRHAGPLAGLRLAAAGRPLEVRVPRLGVSPPVEPISGQSGVLLPPNDPQVLGWWQEGKVAGAQYGSAVVTGHKVHTGGGALDALASLVVGDTIRVRTPQGWIEYVVKRTRIYSRAELAAEAEQVFRLGGPGRLVMITCDDWNGTSYESNAVVYAAPVDDAPFEVPDGGPDELP